MRGKDREKEEEERPRVCSCWRISLPLHPLQFPLWQAHALKTQVGREGAVTREEIQVGERERETEREREGETEREQVLRILPLICLSFTPLCSPVVWRGDWFF